MKSVGMEGRHRSFLDNTVIPHSRVFGRLVMLGKIAIGAAIGVAHGGRFNLGWRRLLLAIISLASFVAIFVNVNLHLNHGLAHPWLIPGNGFNEGVDFDSLMPMIVTPIRS